MSAHPTGGRQAGFTVVELAVSLLALALLTTGVSAVMGTSLQVWQSSQSTTTVEKEANHALDRVVALLAWAGKDGTLGEFEDTDVVTSLPVRQSLGFVDGQPVWGPTTRIEWAPERGEALNGKDDNGNGLVDEGTVVEILNPGTTAATARVLVRGVAPLLEGELSNDLDDNGNGLVDEPGLLFVRKGNAVLVRLTLTRMGTDRKPFLRTMETSVSPRN